MTPDKIPAASGLSNFVRIVAGSFGTSIATTVWQDRAAMHHAQLAEHITPYDAAAVQSLSSLQTLGNSPEQARGMVNQMINQQAYTLAANDILNCGARVIFLFLIAVVWLARPVRGGQAGGGATAAH